MILEILIQVKEVTYIQGINFNAKQLPKNELFQSVTIITPYVRIKNDCSLSYIFSNGKR